PYWETNPPVYSAVEAAALLFGGSPLDYAISTNPNSNDSSTITNTAWYSKWGVAGCHEYAENFSLDLGAPGYNDPTGNDTAISAYVDDNCINGNINYVWQISDSSLFITTWKTEDRKSTRLNSSHVKISYAVFCLIKKKNAAYKIRH